jgi:chromosome segregation ATPase
VGENKSLRANLEKANQRDAEQEGQLAAAEEKIKSLEARLGSVEAAAEALVPATESARHACYTLRLALTDLAARAEGALGDDRSTFDFTKWTQDAAGSVVEVAGAYGDCCARVAVGFVLSLLHEHGCDHVEDFPRTVNKD